MKNISRLLDDIYVPQKAIVIYSTLQKYAGKIYVEAYDMDTGGKPMNAHPLSVEESIHLSHALSTGDDTPSFPASKGLLPAKVLYINPRRDGFAIWYTPAQMVNILFKESLGIPSGKAPVPPLVWKATLTRLYIYALAEEKKPAMKTALCHAPFFNIHESGEVCMGTVDVTIDKSCPLEDFIRQWEHYFWNSNFSHLINSGSPVTGDITQLWQQLVSQSKTFPYHRLISNGQMIKDIML
jgi:PRTRC genetic system protein B